MTSLDLYVTEHNCAPCEYVKEIIEKNELPVNIKVGGYHPLVNSHPTLILDNASVIKGALAIEKYLETHFVK